MNRILQTDLQDAVAKENISLVQQYIMSYQRDILERWTDSTHEDFEKFLRLSDQESARAKRALGTGDTKAELSYYLGTLNGYIEIFWELFREEEQDSRVIALSAAQSAKTDQILLCLYTKNGGQGMRHGELADSIGVSYSALTNTMKRILHSGAVEAARSGKNTYYTLTKAGRRYCAKKQKEARSDQNKLANQILQDIMNRLAANGKEESLGLYPGDKFRMVDQHGITDKEYLLERIITFSNMKFATCEETSDEDSCCEANNDFAESLRTIPASVSVASSSDILNDAL